ncbi:hypothetical protein BRADI_1g09455v3 [Brachypodium distachyon]|uniref:Uncharacterized protein n=1 Tax=Brachypodium distachyon TaxID=15368 RepID=A0A2K2DIS4_BRADI|nr:hypothetical protein BRADI_1g09455v3 [Brachypodium distachyon]
MGLGLVRRAREVATPLHSLTCGPRARYLLPAAGTHDTPGPHSIYPLTGSINSRRSGKPYVRDEIEKDLRRANNVTKGTSRSSQRQVHFCIALRCCSWLLLPCFPLQITTGGCRCSKLEAKPHVWSLQPLITFVKRATMKVTIIMFHQVKSNKGIEVFRLSGVARAFTPSWRHSL